ncbi:unnamed protein product [Didymodactylos carnosus]|uniref:Uncharacterized protein n=1 Tax=Didymodactylos carnosus TaxID=1234261 RepID=A0A815XUW7_9BILA|nr:unnamed protein product [Didymodactylos carnosus]CAF4423493.1 unnamed protein product [Didymodactylos carnosus]
MIFDTSRLPNHVFILKNADFFRFVQSLAGEGLCDLLRIQSINSTEILMSTDDVFDVFKLDSPQFDEMKEKHFFKLRNGQYVVKPGIASSLSFLTKLLQAKQEEQQSSTDDGDQQERTNDFINNHPLLKSLVSWYQHNDTDNNKNACKHSLFDYSTQTTNDNSDELELDEDEDDADDTTNSDAEDNDELLESIGETGDNIDEEVMTSIKSTFFVINIVDKVSPHLNNSYFKIKINEDWQYLHKESC